MTVAVCTFCGWRVYVVVEDLPTVEHPCCRFARERGDERCGGCVDFVNRLERGEVRA